MKKEFLPIVMILLVIYILKKALNLQAILETKEKLLKEEVNYFIINVKSSTVLVGLFFVAYSVIYMTYCGCETKYLKVALLN